MAKNKEEQVKVDKTDLNTDYVVKQGDTISKLATDNGISVGRLKEINNLSSNYLKIGRKLKFK